MDTRYHRLHDGSPGPNTNVTGRVVVGVSRETTLLTKELRLRNTISFIESPTELHPQLLPQPLQGAFSVGGTQRTSLLFKRNTLPYLPVGGNHLGVDGCGGPTTADANNCLQVVQKTVEVGALRLLPDRTG